MNKKICYTITIFAILLQQSVFSMQKRPSPEQKTRSIIFKNFCEQENIEAALNMIHSGEINSKNVDDYFGNGYTFLFYAARYGLIPVVRSLMELGANVNHSNGYGETPLFEAARNGHLEIAKILVEAGANPEEEDYQDETPLSEAQMHNHKNLAFYLANIIAERKRIKAIRQARDIEIEEEVQ